MNGDAELTPGQLQDRQEHDAALARGVQLLTKIPHYTQAPGKVLRSFPDAVTGANYLHRDVRKMQPLAWME